MMPLHIAVAVFGQSIYWDEDQACGFHDYGNAIPTPITLLLRRYQTPSHTDRLTCQVCPGDRDNGSLSRDFFGSGKEIFK